MKFSRKQKSNYPSFTLFEDLFSEFINQSKNIIIHNAPKIKNDTDNWASDNILSTVNGCRTPDEFKKILQKMLINSLTADYHAHR